jgi:RNA polymerase sigma factor (sigma-70 family)
MTRPIPDLITAYQQGDAAAQQELLECLETQLRGLVRALLGKQIRTERESVDVCQSLLLAFHLQAKAGKVKLDSEEALRGYLRAMIRHKLANLSDRIKTAKRGAGKQPASAEDLPLPSFDPSASMVAGTAEMRIQLEQVLEREELAILEGRLAGRTNQEIADDLGKTADAVRMTWNRAREKLVAQGILSAPG